MTSAPLLDRTLAVLRAHPEPPPFPEGALGMEARLGVLKWWSALCQDLAPLQPPFPSVRPERLEEWREVVPHLARSRWPDFPWGRLPWLAPELRQIWTDLRDAAAYGAPADLLSPDYPLPPSVLLGGVPQYLDPAHPFGEGLREQESGSYRWVCLSLGGPPHIWEISRFHPQAPIWEELARPEHPNMIDQDHGIAASPAHSEAWADMVRAWIVHQVLVGSLQPGAYRSTRHIKKDGERSLNLRFSMNDVCAPGLVRELLEGFFPAGGRGALAAFHPGIMIHVSEELEPSSPERQAEAIRRWAEVMSSLRAFPESCRVTFWTQETAPLDPNWPHLQAGAQVQGKKLDLAWSSVGYSEWFLTSKPRY